MIAISIKDISGHEIDLNLKHVIKHTSGQPLVSRRFFSAKMAHQAMVKIDYKFISSTKTTVLSKYFVQEYINFK